MNGVSPVVPAVLMIAAVALLIGGVRLVRRPAERQRGVLMLVAAAVFLGNVLILGWPS